ncbi:MAG: tyrosine-protein phosphatase [Atopobiaceae bacterium]|nr:tyrosine-protein phosphatase [Atopobiaceae bacterium]
MELHKLTGYVAGFHDGLNLRELGGYPSSDGRVVKKGVIYRSGALGEASADELKRIEALKLRLIVDLRSAKESDKLPDPYIAKSLRVRMSGALDADGKEVNMAPTAMVNYFRNPRRVDDDPEESFASTLAETYASLAFHNLAYRMVFRQLEHENVPLLFHCTAGKDRTGALAMLILLALGVDEDTAVADYMLTNRYRHQAISESQRKNKQIVRLLPRLKEVLPASQGVVESFGRRVLEEILQEYGSYDHYFEKEYGLNEKRRAALQERYLVPADTLNTNAL